MRAVIMAGGDGTRWGNHRGIPKHLVDVEGVPLIERTAGQFADRGCEVVILGPDDERYDVGHTLVAPSFTGCDTDKFLSTVQWWLPYRPTVIVYGDCYLTDAAVSALVASSPLSFVGRAGPSAFTGCEWGELFGVHVEPGGFGRLASAIVRVRGLLLGGELGRGGGWEVYRSTECVPLDRHEVRGGFVEVDDWSDDFDFPEDYERWLERRSLCVSG